MRADRGRGRGRVRITFCEVLIVLAIAVALQALVAYARQAHGAENFTGSAAAIVERAETARRDQALFWFDRELPRWSSPCPITIRETDRHSGGGATSFSFDRGEVFGWRMTVEGSRRQLLDSIVPHEVNHTLFASELRRPLVRWADEGSAALFEAPDEHAQYRRLAKQFATHPARALRHADETNYPSRPENTLPLYATGHSVVEWLLAAHGRTRFLAFVADERPPSVSFPQHFGIDVATADARWQSWIVGHPIDCESAGCPIHAPRLPDGHVAQKPGLPTLEVFTSKLCIPCAAFWLDVNTDPAFRSAIGLRARLVPVDVDIEREKALARGITRVPTFAIGTTTLVGYPGKAGLIRLLDQAVAAVPRPAPTRVPAPVDPGFAPPPPVATTPPATFPPPAVVDPGLAPPPSTDPGPFAPPPQPPYCVVPSATPTPPAPPPADRGSLAGDIAKAVAPKLVPALLPFLPEGLAALAVPAAVASGPVGLGILAGGALLRMWRRRRAGRGPPAAPGGPACADTFRRPTVPDTGPVVERLVPRDLREAHQLQQLRQLEGRHPALDATVGMVALDVLENEIDAESKLADVARELKSRIMARVDTIAPLSAKE